jgi:uncharacterized membrane protein YedE/YeeE
MHVTGFTPVAALVGGLIIGVAAALLWLVNGRIAGISGIVAGIFARDGEARWRLAFLVGMIVGGFVMHLVRPSAFGLPPGGTGTLLVGGLCVGFGTRMAGGCTSGHGLCGTSRLSKRSLVATATFMAAGIAVVFVVRHLVGGAR